MNTNEDLIPLATPGEILREEYLEPMDLTQREVSRATGIPYTRFNEIIRGQRRISAEYSMRLGRYFGQNPRFWLNIQADNDLRLAELERGEAVIREVEPLAVA